MKRKSEETAQRLGYPILESLPLLLDELPTPRAADDVASRAIALNVIVSASFGMPPELARRVIERENLSDHVAADERIVLHEDAEGAHLRVRVEALWALAWSLGFVETLDFTNYCGDNLRSLLPAPESEEPSQAFRARARLRNVEDLIEATDLAYRLHWAVVDASLHGQPQSGAVEPYVVVERRHALEWVLDREAAWNDISLDT